VNVKKKGMPVCDPVLRNQLSNLSSTVEGQDADQDFVEALVTAQLESYKLLMDMSSKIVDSFIPTKKKTSKTL